MNELAPSSTSKQCNKKKKEERKEVSPGDPIWYLCPEENFVSVCDESALQEIL